MKLKLPAHMLHNMRSSPIKVDVIGAGGSGSQMINGLARLHLAMLAQGQSQGLQVRLWDDDVVSPANIGRQAFYPSDVGAPKASTLINRLNMAFGLGWISVQQKVTSQARLASDFVIGCVDTRRARASILSAARRSRSDYWLDLGNTLDSAQAILGEVRLHAHEARKRPRLPHAADLFPELVNPKLDADDDVPSCSLAEALEKQSLFVNTMVATHACSMLANLFRYGELDHHGFFVNLRSGHATPLPVSPETWVQFGYDISLKPSKRKVDATRN